MFRALATIEAITAIEAHPNAQMLEIAQVRGWRCVVRKADQFKTGQHILYVEPDAHLDVADERFAFLAKGGMKTNAAGWKGHRLRTVKLRGVVSQGLVMPLCDFPELDQAVVEHRVDVTDLLPIRLWEPLIPFSSEAIGSFPIGVPKTDEQRIQNCTKEELAEALAWSHIEITEKLDGTSVTAFVKEDGTVGVAGRNWELSPDSTASQVVVASAAGRWLDEQEPGVFLQGELIGPNIQGNPYKLTAPRWLLFTTGLLSEGYPCRMDPAVILPDEALMSQMVPRITPGIITHDATVDELIGFADGIRSMLNPDVLAEGVVIRGYDEAGVLRSSFKSISNAYLIKHG